MLLIGQNAAVLTMSGNIWGSEGAGETLPMFCQFSGIHLPFSGPFVTVVQWLALLPPSTPVSPTVQRH